MQEKIKARRLEILSQQSRTGLLFPPVLAMSMAYVFREQLAVTSMMPWLSIFLFITGNRLYSAHIFVRSENASSNIDFWFSWHIFGVIISGIIWGGFILLLARSSDPVYISLIVICATGLCTGAMAVYSFSFLSFVMFVIPLLTPLGIFFVVGDHSSISSLAYFNFLFLITIIITSWKLNRTTSHSLCLYIENQELLTALETEKRQIIGTNKKLEEDLKSRIQTEAKLLHEKRIAEDISKELKILSTQDSLTGINNRRRFDEALYDEWYRASRLSRPLSLVLCDIDKFKEYNDTYGHVEGDKCLTRVAHLIDDYARRAGDMAARFGGEEFVIILPDAEQEHAKAIAEQIRIAIMDLGLPHGASPVANIITASFGVCTKAPDRDTSPKTLIECADKAMYLAKKQGRNKVVSYQNVSEE